MSNLLILGEAALLKAAVETALSQYPLENIAVLTEDCRETQVLGAQVLGRYVCAAEYKDTCGSAMAAIPNGALRLHWMNRLQKLGYALPALVHPQSAVSPYATVGEGSFIHLGAMINAGTAVGRGCMICSGCIIAHDCTVRDGVNMCCGAHIERGCALGYRARIGTGAMIGANVCVGNDAVICPGSVVEANVGDAMIVSGAPACVIGNAAFDMM